MGKVLGTILKVTGLASLLGVGGSSVVETVSEGLSFGNIFTAILMVVGIGVGIWALFRFVK